MKTTRTITVDICDICGVNDAYPWSICKCCGKAICPKCFPDNAITYRAERGCSGPNDAVYCFECEAKLTAADNDKLFNAYARLRKHIINTDRIREEHRTVTKFLENEIQVLFTAKSDSPSV